MTFGQSSNAALDKVIRNARHLLFAFDGPIRSADTGNPPAPYIHDVLAACRESGRSAVVITPTPVAEVHAYLDTHDLLIQITLVAASIAVAISQLEAVPTDCAAITSSPTGVTMAQAAGVHSIAYAKTLDDAEHLVQAGAVTYMYSMSDLTLRLRALPS